MTVTKHFENQLKATELFKEIATWEINKQIDFTERLLFEITVMNRALWDDPETDNAKKVDCLKWSNELSHGIWNLLHDLKNGTSENVSRKILDNILLYTERCPELKGHVASSIKRIVE